MEFLSSQITSNSSPINLVLHSLLTEERGGDAKNTPTFKVVSLPFAADEGFHEYRFGNSLLTSLSKPSKQPSANQIAQISRLATG